MIDVPIGQVNFPGTETSAHVRPVFGEKANNRSAVSSDAPLSNAEGYLRSLAQAGHVTSQVAEQAIVVLEAIRQTAQRAGIPTIATVDGLVGMTWESSRQHVNIQILTDRTIEYFAEDLVSGGRWSGESSWGAVDAAVYQHLGRVP